VLRPDAVEVERVTGALPLKGSVGATPVKPSPFRSKRL